MEHKQASKDNQQEFKNNLINIFDQCGPEARLTGEQIVNYLFDRKQRLYPNNKRTILSFEYGLLNGKLHLNVASTLN